MDPNGRGGLKTVSRASRPLRVLRVIARLNVGGPARHAVILNDGLQRRGFDTLLVFGAVGPTEGSLDELARNLPVERIPELGRRIRAWSDLRAFCRIVTLLWRWQPDIVHTHTAKAGALGRVAAVFYNTAARRARRAAVIHTFHGHVFEGYFGRFGTAAVRLIERTLARVTDRIVTISARQYRRHHAPLRDRASRKGRCRAPRSRAWSSLGVARLTCPRSKRFGRRRPGRRRGLRRQARSDKGFEDAAAGNCAGEGATPSRSARDRGRWRGAPSAPGIGDRAGPRRAAWIFSDGAPTSQRSINVWMSSC